MLEVRILWLKSWEVQCSYTLDSEINKHFIYIDGVVGLTKENAEVAIKILNKV